MSLVVDASVVAKWFFKEEHQASALSVLKLKKELLAPDLLWPEFGSVVWKRHLLREITLEEASDTVDQFMECPIECCPTPPLLARALALAKYTGASSYDAFYLALADEKRGVLVTADKRLCEAAKKMHIQFLRIG